jgi:hypothetical protein
VSIERIRVRVELGTCKIWRGGIHVELPRSRPGLVPQHNAI